MSVAQAWLTPGRCHKLALLKAALDLHMLLQGAIMRMLTRMHLELEFRLMPSAPHEALRCKTANAASRHGASTLAPRQAASSLHSQPYGSAYAARHPAKPEGLLTQPVQGHRCAALLPSCRPCHLCAHLR